MIIQTMKIGKHSIQVRTRLLVPPSSRYSHKHTRRSLLMLLPVLHTGGAGAHGGSGTAVYGGPRPGGESSGGAADRLVAAAQAQGSAAASDSRPAAGHKLHVTLYKNGFTVNDGPLRDPSGNEADASFLNDLLAGRLPAELHGKIPPGEIDVALNDKRGEDYRPPTPPAYVAFGGEGQQLSSSAGPGEDAVVYTAEAQAYPAAESSGDAPETRVRVQLADGKRVMLKLPESCTVLTLQGEVARASPDVPAFTLVAGYPPATLRDANATLKEAGLCNAAVTQKLAS